MSFSKQSILTNLIWKFAESWGAQIVGFVVSIILARILEPTDYGIIALIMVVISILQVFADSGLGNSLIQKKDPDDLDYSTVFFTNVIISVILYISIWILAPCIADFYNLPQIIPFIRVLGLILPINAFRNIQNSYIAKHMIFKRFFFATLIGSLSSAVIGIYLAYNGAGVWALIVQQLIGSGVNTIVLWITVPWHPSAKFSTYRLKILFSFGWKLLCASFFDTLYKQIWQLIIGKQYSASDLAYFNKGQSFPQIIVTNINTAINSILLPVMSSEQDNISRVRQMTRRAIKTSIFIMAPLMMLLCFTSENVVCLLLTEKWLPSVPFLCIFCINFMFWPIHTANLNAINALGRSDIFLCLEIVKKIVGITIVIFTMQYGVMAMAYGLLLDGVLSQIINSWPNRKLLGYGYLHQLRDLLPSIALAVIAGAAAYGIGMMQLPIHLVLVIALQVIAGAVTYLALSYLFHVDSLLYLFQVIKPLIARKIG